MKVSFTTECWAAGALKSFLCFVGSCRNCRNIARGTRDSNWWAAVRLSCASSPTKANRLSGALHFGSWVTSEVSKYRWGQLIFRVVMSCSAGQLVLWSAWEKQRSTLLIPVVMRELQSNSSFRKWGISQINGLIWIGEGWKVCLHVGNVAKEHWQREFGQVKQALLVPTAQWSESSEPHTVPFVLLLCAVTHGCELTPTVEHVHGYGRWL